MGTVQLDSQPSSPAVVVYDPGDNLGNGVVQGAGGADESRVMRRPTLIEVENLLTGTTIDVQVKTLDDLAFKSFAILDGATDTEFLVEFLQPYNFVKLVRTGAQNAVASAQFGNVGHGAL